MAVVEEAQFGLDFMAVRSRTRQQRLDLTVNGVSFSLPIGRDSGVERRSDRGYKAGPASRPSLAASPVSSLRPASRTGRIGRDSGGSRRW
jgi:hypothetical protein